MKNIIIMSSMLMVIFVSACENPKLNTKTKQKPTTLTFKISPRGSFIDWHIKNETNEVFYISTSQYNTDFFNTSQVDSDLHFFPLVTPYDECIFISAFFEFGKEREENMSTTEVRDHQGNDKLIVLKPGDKLSGSVNLKKIGKDNDSDLFTLPHPYLDYDTTLIYNPKICNPDQNVKISKVSKITFAILHTRKSDYIRPSRQRFYYDMITGTRKLRSIQNCFYIKESNTLNYYWKLPEAVFLQKNWNRTFRKIPVIPQDDFK